MNETLQILDLDSRPARPREAKMDAFTVSIAVLGNVSRHVSR
ncbi:hypothetical protein ACPSL3_28390 (plasmid) [Vibrio owensii]